MSFFLEKLQEMEEMVSDLETSSEDESSTTTSEEQEEDLNVDVVEATKNDSPLYLLKKNQVSHSLLLYTPFLTKNLAATLQNDKLLTLMSMPVSVVRCPCNGGSLATAKVYLYRFVLWCKHTFNENMFAGIVSGLLKLTTVTREVKWGGYTIHCCKKCKLYTWWLSSFNNDTNKYLSFLLQNAVVKIEWEDSRHCNQIRDVLLDNEHTWRPFLNMYLTKARPDSVKRQAAFVRNFIIIMDEHGEEITRMGFLTKILEVCEKFGMNTLANCIRLGPEEGEKWWQQPETKRTLMQLKRIKQ